MNNKVFLLWFVQENPHEEDTELLIGVYADAADAQAAIARLKHKPGFSEDPAGFQIHPHTVGQDCWTEGFVHASVPVPAAVA
jgi:hypothetical protein